MLPNVNVGVGKADDTTDVITVTSPATAVGFSNSVGLSTAGFGVLNSDGLVADPVPPIPKLMALALIGSDFKADAF